jgi:hypothetical protein
MGQMRSRVWRDDIHDLARCPRGHECASSGRRVTCAKASAGKRSGTSGPTSARPISRGRAPKPPSEAGGSIPPVSNCWPHWRQHLVRGKPSRAWRIHGRGPSMTCSTEARLVLCTHACRPTGGESVRGTPHGTAVGGAGASTLAKGSRPASVHAPERSGRDPCAPRLMRHRLPRRLIRHHVSTVGVCCFSPAPAPHGGMLHGYPVG